MYNCIIADIQCLFPMLGNPSAASADINESNAADDSGNNWFVPQDNVAGSVPTLINSPKYGFANKISGALTAFEVLL